MTCTKAKVCLAVGIGGLCAVLLGVITGWVVVPKIVRSKIADILPLRVNSESWDRWENLPVPIQYRVYIFRVNNPGEILEGKMPSVSQVGPYVYKEKRKKEDLLVDEEKSTVEYNHKLIFEFDANASAPLSEDDVLTVVNAPAVLFGLIVDNLKAIDPVIGLYNTSIEKMWPTKDKNPLFIDVKVKDYLFDGLPLYCNQTKTLDNVDTTILCEAFRILHPKTTILDYFGKGIHSFAFFKYKNNTSDGVYKIDLGIKDVTKIGQVLSWNGKKSLSLWKGEHCNRILGTDTTIFRPYLKEDNIQSLYIYHTDVCRSIRLGYSGDTEYKGVKGRRYVPDGSFLGSVLDNPENHCFCPQSVKQITHYGGCLRPGVLELTGCQGAPVVVSYPHFLLADPIYQGKVEGLKPELEQHQTFLDLEPNTGYPLRAASRVQINAFLKSIPSVRVMKNLPNVLIPALWIEEKMELTDELIETINSQLLNILRIVDIVKWLIIVFGIVLFGASCIYYYLKGRNRQQRVDHIPNKPQTTFEEQIQNTKPQTTFEEQIQNTKPQTTFEEQIQNTKPQTTFEEQIRKAVSLKLESPSGGNKF